MASDIDEKLTALTNGSIYESLQDIYKSVYRYKYAKLETSAKVIKWGGSAPKQPTAYNEYGEVAP